MIYLGFVAILPIVFRPQIPGAPGVRPTGLDRGLEAVRWWAVVGVFGCLSWGCREAQTPLGPPPPGSSDAPPVITTFPGRDTTADSIGLLNIEVIAQSRTLIDTVRLEISGAAIAFPPDVVHDTVYDAIFTVALGQLHHQPFSFRVSAGDILGRDTVTDSITVRLR